MAFITLISSIVIIIVIKSVIVESKLMKDAVFSEYVNMQIAVGDRSHQVKIGMFGYDVPKTTANFVGLCIAIEGNGYLNSKFHRVISGFIIQGGDYTSGDGTGGRSIYGSTFDDENFDIDHSQEGAISMANYGPDTNISQFAITVSLTPWLNGKHVVFGKVVENYEWVKEISDMKTGANDRPLVDVVITKCSVSSVDQEKRLNLSLYKVMFIVFSVCVFVIFLKRKSNL